MYIDLSGNFTHKAIVHTLLADPSDLLVKDSSTWMFVVGVC